MIEIAAIALMGLVTYACRVGGWLLVARLRPRRWLTAWLGHIPGAVFAALVAPMVAAAGPPGWLAAAAGFAVARASGHFLVAMGTGLLVYILLNRMLP